MNACSGSKKLPKIINEDPRINLDSLLNKIYEHQEYKTYFAKGTASYSGADFEGTADAQLKVVKDSFAICVIKKLGIELLRLYINHDSITILDRIDKSWQRQSIQDWTARLLLPIDYFMIQDLITTGFYLSEYLSYEWKQSKDTSLLIGSSELFQFNTKIQVQALASQEIDFHSFGNYCKIKIPNHQIVSDRNIPSRFIILFRSKLAEEKFIRFAWKEIKLNTEENLKFDIPTHYTRR